MMNLFSTSTRFANPLFYKLISGGAAVDTCADPDGICGFHVSFTPRRQSLLTLIGEYELCT